MPPLSRSRPLWLLAAALTLIAAFVLWRTARPEAGPDPLLQVLDQGVPVAGSLPSGLPQPSASTATVTVHLTGPVAHPGVVTLPAGARVGDAVEAAGGFGPGAEPGTVNLARILTDGEQLDLAVPVPTSATAGSGTLGSGTAGGGGGKVDLNTATAEQLDELPGVGPVMAERIIRYRSENGPFASVEQLQEVPGIGDARLADLAPLVTAGAG